MSNLLNGNLTLKDSLKHGDMQRIAEATGLSHNYVWRVLRYGDRQSKKIEAAAKQLIEQRKVLKATHSK